MWEDESEYTPGLLVQFTRELTNVADTKCFIYEFGQFRIWLDT